VVGEWQLCLLGIRQDLTFKAFDSGVITDDTGAIIFEPDAAGHARAALRRQVRLRPSQSRRR
jgi:hypothetical protein